MFFRVSDELRIVISSNGNIISYAKKWSKCILKQTSLVRVSKVGTLPVYFISLIMK